ncbi:hypothetical protein E2320_003163 [Naja naja]|nr:hypothetical protein E2320_003163 [Naja naja]
MMWPNFFLQDREQRIAMRRRGETQRQKVLTDEQEGKIKLAFFVAIVGMTLTVLAVGTEFWVELNTYKQNHSAICEAAHFGLWKFCYKKLWVYDVGEERHTCGPAELPGDHSSAFCRPPSIPCPVTAPSYKQFCCCKEFVPGNVPGGGMDEASPGGDR